MKNEKFTQAAGIILMAAVSLCLYACNKDNPVPKLEPSLSVTKSDGSDLAASMDVSADSNQISFNIAAVADEWGYTISDDAYWLSVADKSDSTLTLTVSPEHTGEKRTGSITFWLRAYLSITQKVEINQAAGEKIIIVPQADMLDVVFHDDGTAEDVSPMHMTVKKVSYDHPFTVALNNEFQLNAVHFLPAGIGVSYKPSEGSFFRIDYGDSTHFKEMLAAGHSFEALVKFDNDYVTNVISGETKIFSTQQSGGGSLIQITSGGHNPKNSIAFCDYTNNDQVKDQGGSQHFIESYLQPNASTWYDIVGVYDPVAGKSYVYVNGEQKGELSTPGFYSFPKSTEQWIGIGGDAGPDGRLEAPFGGEIAIARIYGKVLTAEEIKNLWDKVNGK